MYRFFPLLKTLLHVTSEALIDRGVEPEDNPTARTPLNPAAEVRRPDKPIPVEVREPEPKPCELYQRIAGTVHPPLATAGIVAKGFR